MTDLTIPVPNLVQITRSPKSPGDLVPVEHYVGYLVDEYGNDVETPEVGYPIYLTGEEKQLTPWLFASDPVFSIDVYEDHWSVITEQGNLYKIKNDRTLN